MRNIGETGWELLKKLLLNLKKELAVFCGCFADIKEEMEDYLLEDPVVLETHMVMTRLSRLGEFCARYMDYGTDSESVFWMEKKRLSSGDIFAQLWITPLEIRSWNRTVPLSSLRRHCRSIGRLISGLRV